MLILGINGGFRQGYQDVAACLVEDGVLLAAVEEERLNRIKFSPGTLPYHSILAVLKKAEKQVKDITHVAFHGSTWGNFIYIKLEDYFLHYFDIKPIIKVYHHHDCHAASTYFASCFDEALIFTMDSSGDGVSMQIALGKNNKIEVVNRFERPNSLGIFYSLITQYCGFKKESDEYKVMGLSSYGNRNKFDFSWLIDFKNGALTLNPDYLISIPPKTPSPHQIEMLFSDKFIDKMGIRRRLPNEAISDFYYDVAASAQQHIEKLMASIVKHYIIETNVRNVSFAGGVALNCVMNQAISNLEEVNNLFVQPASSDAGISIGAAWLLSNEFNINPIVPKNYYLGNAYSNSEILQVLKRNHINFKKIENPEIIAAQLIKDNNVISWFQGAMEFGPRALGNRSILANPCNEKMQEIVNSKIKFRESFRPFCPSVLEEDKNLYFTGKPEVAPYMNITFSTTVFAKNEIPAVCHIDNTARIHTVNEKQNPLFYKLLVELKKINGHGVVLNTSFNLSHEPIVCSPQDAIASFFASGLDALFINNFLISKHAK
jgi:carbamoyltransferase